MKNTLPMKTATAHDLLTRLPTILAWLEAGEEVVVKPKAVKPTKATQAEQKVDWSQSAAFRDRTNERSLAAQETAELTDESKRVNQSIVFTRPRLGQLNMTKEELQEFYEDMRGSY